MPKSIQIAYTVPNGSYAQNQTWFATPKLIDDLGKFRINIAITTQSVVEYTVDNLNWIKINNGFALKPSCSYGFDIYVRAGDKLNLRSPTEGSTNVILCRLDSIKDEG